ncbi:hypothetical protein [Dokdonella sp.]|uniref:hypothetical protein n=1 Tax=Dokdonella sp. TaxID=2291710 RepID=UPI002638601D|nr:hypothetical protein [Dokdonella sp.]
MTYSDPNLWIIIALVPLSVAVTATANWLFRKRGGIATGWGGALFIGLCWVAALALIIQRVLR